MELHAFIEAILFWKGEPQSFSALARMTGKSEDEVREAVRMLEERLSDHGVRLVHKDAEVMLTTAPEASTIIEAMIKDELSKDLGKAGLETLSIVLYMGPISRSDIDYVRGVNSTFILRNLLVRGLVEKISNPDDSRSFLYRPSFDLLSYLGVSRVEEIPAYEETRSAITAFHTEKGRDSKGTPETVETNVDTGTETELTTAETVPEIPITEPQDHPEEPEHGRA